MNDLVKLTEEIVKSLVVDADGVSVKEFPSEDEKVIAYIPPSKSRRNYKKNIVV